MIKNITFLILLIILIQPVTALNTSVTVLASPTQTNTVHPSSSSSSSGSMGVVSDEPLSNVACSNKSTKNWRYVTQTKYEFNCGNIYEVIINPQENIPEVMFKLETLKANSTKTTALSSVYNYINIYSGAKRFNTSIIHFKLPLNWVSDKSSITLMKWSNGSWISLPTIEISSDLSYKYYEAITDSFSSFVITGNIKQAESATVTVPTIIPTVTEIPFPIVTIAIANQIPTHSTLDVIAVTIISIAIIILLSILIYIKRNSLKEYFKQKFL